MQIILDALNRVLFSFGLLHSVIKKQNLITQTLNTQSETLKIVLRKHRLSQKSNYVLDA